MLYPKKSIHEILAAATEVSVASEMVYQIEDEWRKRLWTILAVVVSFFLLAGSAVAGVSYFMLSKQKDRQEASLLTSVQAISKLATVQHHYSDIIEWKESKDFYLFELQKSILASSSASVLAGINLENSQVSMDREGSFVKIVFPHAEIFSIDSQLHFSGEDDTFFQRISLEDRNRLIDESKENVRKQALEAGILKQAEEKASSQITEYLGSLGYEAEILFQ